MDKRNGDRLLSCEQLGQLIDWTSTDLEDTDIRVNCVSFDVKTVLTFPTVPILRQFLRSAYEVRHTLSAGGQL